MQPGDVSTFGTVQVYRTDEEAARYFKATYDRILSGDGDWSRGTPYEAGDGKGLLARYKGALDVIEGKVYAGYGAKTCFRSNNVIVNIDRSGRTREGYPFRDISDEQRQILLQKQKEEGEKSQKIVQELVEKLAPNLRDPDPESSKLFVK